MATKKHSNLSVEVLIAQNNDLLKKQLILQLYLQQVPQQDIRCFVGGKMGDITKAIKHLKKMKGMR